jgi:glycosyltransferase involved in cell wall biosynthesis
MKICFVTPEFVTEVKNFDGGLSNYLYRVSLGLLELGHQPVVVVASDVTEVIIYREIEVHRVLVESQFQSGVVSRLYQSYVLNQYLVQYNRESAVDLVQYASFLGVGYYRLPDLPSVVRISSYEPLWMTYYGHDIGLFSDEIALEEAAIRRADGVFGPSKILAQEIEKNCGCPVQVIESPFIYDEPELDYTYFETFQLKKYLLFFGTLGLLKGVNTIADALPEILSRHRDLSFVFIGKDAGFGGMKMMEYVYTQAGANRDRIIYIDKLEHKRLYPFVEKALAVVLPSRIDNFPNTCIEAMAHGKIVVGTHDTGFEQLIHDGVSGFLCERDNPGSLVDAINQVLKLEKEKKISIENSARERIRFLHPQFVVNDHIEFYKKTIIDVKQKPFHCQGIGDEFVARLLWEELTQVNSERSRILSQYQQFQVQSQQAMDDIRLSKTYILGRKLERVLVRLFPYNSKSRRVLSLIYHALYNRIRKVTENSKKSFNQM